MGLSSDAYDQIAENVAEVAADGFPGTAYRGRRGMLECAWSQD